MPASTRITPEVLERPSLPSALFSPHPDLDRGLTQRPGQLSDPRLQLLLTGRGPGPTCREPSLPRLKKNQPSTDRSTARRPSPAAQPRRSSSPSQDTPAQSWSSSPPEQLAVHPCQTPLQDPHNSPATKPDAGQCSAALSQCLLRSGFLARRTVPNRAATNSNGSQLEVGVDAVGVSGGGRLAGEVLAY